MAAIKVENIGKCYTVDHESNRAGYRTLREGLIDFASSRVRRLRGDKSDDGRHEQFWALDDVSFDVQEGEVVGIIGRNGAGKSTLLKILSQITKPTRGQIALKGRVGSLLEVGTGFHPELTGRENIFLNGAILGMGRQEIGRKFDQIVDFSGVEKFLDTPVKRYSSGMYVRLAFAVAAHLDLEILLVDEVLAVGDIAFQQKCLGKMGDIANSGRTVLLVSHNLATLSNLCTRAVWLNRGRVAQSGDTMDIIGAYCKQVSDSFTAGSSTSLADHPGRAKGSSPLLQRVAILDDDENPTTNIRLGGSFTIEVEAHWPRRSEIGFIIDICDQFGSIVARANSRIQSQLDFSAGNSDRVQCRIENFRFLPGSYLVNVAIGNGAEFLDRVEGAMRFTVEPADVYGTGQVPSTKNGIFALESEWRLPASGRPGARMLSAAAV